MMKLIRIICLTTLLSTLYGCSRYYESSLYIQNLSGEDADNIQISFAKNSKQVSKLKDREDIFIQSHTKGEGMLSINYDIRGQHYEQSIRYAAEKLTEHCDIRIYLKDIERDCYKSTVMDRLLKRQPITSKPIVYREFEDIDTK